MSNDLNFDINHLTRQVQSMSSVRDIVAYLEKPMALQLEVFKNDTGVDFEEFVEKHFEIHNKLTSAVFWFLGSPKKNYTRPKDTDNRVAHLKGHVFKYSTFVETGLLDNLIFPYKMLLSLIEDEVNYPFFRQQILDKIDSFNDDVQTYQWLKHYNDFLENCIFYFNKIHYNLLKEKYNPKKLFPKNRKHAFYDYGIIRKTPENLKYYISKNLLIFVFHRLKEFKLKERIQNAKAKYPDGFSDLNDKFPDFEFDFDYVTDYCDSVFNLVEDQIEYFNYLIFEYKTEKGENGVLNSKQKKLLIPFEQKLEYLNTVLNLKKNRNENTAGISNNNSGDIITAMNHFIDKIGNVVSNKEEIKQPVSKGFSQLIKHYFEISEGVHRVPKLEELASKHYSISSWSKLFDNEVFLMALHKRIDKKLKSKRIGSIKKDLFMNLLLDINSKINAKYKNKIGDEGQTNKNNRELDEDRYIDDEYLS